MIKPAGQRLKESIWGQDERPISLIVIRKCTRTFWNKVAAASGNYPNNYINEYRMSRRIWQKRPQSTEAVPILVAFTSSLGTGYLRNSGLSMGAICSITRNRGNRSFFFCSLLDSFLYQCPLCKPRSWWNLWFQGIFCTNLQQFACHQSASTNYR